jgi:hypothetical protein
MRRPVLYTRDILRWADAFRARNDRFPNRNDGPVDSVLDLTWCAIDQALKKGNRGLRPGQSLAKLFLQHRKRRHRNYLPHFTVNKILVWADAHHDCTGKWPTFASGKVAGASGETWRAVDKALRNGRRGLSGASSLARLLEARRGVRNRANVPDLLPEEVLAWADAHHERKECWPTRKSGPIPEAPDETWWAVDAAFVAGSRGLAGFGSLVRFLARHRGVRNPKALPRLSVKKIKKWIKEHHERTGRWPIHTSGPIQDAPGETWGGVHYALRDGRRGLPGGSSLYHLRGGKNSPRRRGA